MILPLPKKQRTGARNATSDVLTACQLDLIDNLVACIVLASRMLERLLQNPGQTHPDFG